MSDLPKVSGILPVGHGAKFFQVALQSFLTQDYEGELELIVVDNSDQPIEDLLPADDRIKYLRTERKAVGALRNIGTKEATGEICVSIDEDDWSAANRISHQVNRLLMNLKSVTGFHSIFYYDVADGKTFKYWYMPGSLNHPPYACGSSQMYLKSWWERHPFPIEGVEDYTFGNEALHHNQLDSCDGAQLFVARAHRASVCPPTQLGQHRQFPAVPKEELPAEFYLAIAEPPVKAKAKSKAQIKA